MTETQVKKVIGEDNWGNFMKWMYGQTYGVNEDGTADYYPTDVNAFMLKLQTGYDRQQDPMYWD